uniref:Uncharacterized protein n=2 Tax=Rhizophora mucronata TaxID=61149 RepID=A0A2P2JDR9_RHIMU
MTGKHGNKIKLNNRTHLFLYQLVGTWGQILFPKPWKEFRLWYDEHKAKGLKPFLDGMVTNGWYKKLGERIWTPWFIKFVHSKGYFNIYTNFQHEGALSVSHRDAGVNYGKTAGPDSHLLDKSSFDFNYMEMQPLSSLKWYDFCFREVLPGRVVRTLDELGSVLLSVQSQRTIIVVSIFDASEIVARNLLCHFERLNIQNYIFIGPPSDFLSDLARRGHPVIDAGKLLDSIKPQKLLNFEDSSKKLMTDIIVKACIIKKCLEVGYDSWTVDANVLFGKNDPFQEFSNLINDFYVGKTMDFFFAKSSPSARSIWSDVFLDKVASTVSQTSIPRERRNFVSIVGKLLEQNGVRIGSVDETTFGMKIDSNGFNQSFLENGKKMVYWSKEMGLDSIKKKLDELSMWVVDVDSSCMAVICHQS